MQKSTQLSLFTESELNSLHSILEDKTAKVELCLVRGYAVPVLIFEAVANRLPADLVRSVKLIRIPDHFHNFPDKNRRKAYIIPELSRSDFQETNPEKGD